MGQGYHRSETPPQDRRVQAQDCQRSAQRQGGPHRRILEKYRDIYSGHCPPPWWGGSFVQMKNREEFAGGLYVKRKGKGGKRRKK